MTPRLSKVVLTSHITFSVGWLGAVTVFLALAITGLNSPDIQVVRACSIAMKLSAWFVIVPFCLTSLFTGIIQASGTKWGLFNYYWIVIKLFLTVAATIFLLLHIQPINRLVGLTSDASFPNSQTSVEFINLISKAGAAILVLVFLTTISIYKPWGRMLYKRSPGNDSKKNSAKPVNIYLLIGLIGLVLILIIMHLLGGKTNIH